MARPSTYEFSWPWALGAQAFHRFWIRAVFLAALPFFLLSPPPGHAGTILIIGDDHGGKVSDRQRQIAQIRQQKLSVEIRGTHCLSSCTMLLALPDLCIHPDTIFGFHGPTDFGEPLLPQQFEYWSQIIAKHYPPALRRWYLQTARHRLTGYYNMTGRQIAAHGINLCNGQQSQPYTPQPIAP